MHNVAANGAGIPAIGLGTWTLKGEACATLVREALRIGYRHVDTAPTYRNEAAVGEGIRASGLRREEVFLTTKVWWTELEPDAVRRSAEASLAALGTDYVDLLLIHWPNPKVPLKATLEAFAKLHEEGLARNIGVSNFTLALMAEALRETRVPLAVNQIERHPYLDQSRIHAACRAAGMAQTSYTPLHRGGDLLAEPVVTAAAAAHGRTPGQVVLRWHVQQDGVVAIPRTSKVERLAENLAIFDFSLTDAEMAAISALARPGSRVCDFDFSPQWDAA